MKGKIRPSHAERTTKKTKKQSRENELMAKLVKWRQVIQTEVIHNTLLHDMGTDFNSSCLASYSLEVMVGLN